MVSSRQGLNGTFSVYFFPFTHGGDFVLETEVRFIEGSDDDVEIQLLTRDSERSISRAEWVSSLGGTK